MRSWREWSDRYNEFGRQLGGVEKRERDRHRRPGVWHVDYERVIEVRSGGEPEWVAVCGCGAAGSPASLAWQHGMCGPCADRIAEFGPEAVKHTPGLLADNPLALQVVALAPSGVILGGGPNWFRAWDATGARIANGQIIAEMEAARYVPSLRVSSDGRFVIISSFAETLTLLDLAASSPRQFGHRLTRPGGTWWTGRANELLFQAEGQDSFELIDAVTGSTKPVVAPGLVANVGAVKCDATTPHVVVAAGHRGTLARLEGDALVVESNFVIGEGRLNRTGLWQGGPTITRFTPDGERVLFIRETEMELRHPAKPKALVQAEFPQPIRDAAFAPDYEHLFLLGADGILYVCNPGSLKGVRAQLRWHLGPVWRLAVSPDGQMLATAGTEGVKLWPLTQLLPLLE